MIDHTPITNNKDRISSMLNTFSKTHHVIEASGLGNKFIIIDCDHLPVKLSQGHSTEITPVQEEYYRQLLIESKRDTLLLIGNIENDFKVMRILEKDGSGSLICGNGLRAVSEYYYQKEGLEKISVQTRSGLVLAHRLNNSCVSTELGLYNYHRKISLYDQEIYFTDIGEPHAIMFAAKKEVDKIFVSIGPEIIQGKFNLNVVSQNPSNPYLIYIRTLERGVNNETLACGTGAACAAITYGQQILGKTEAEIIVQTRSGELRVIYSPLKVKLLGPAKIEKIY